jgi:hypothetical protein
MEEYVLKPWQSFVLQFCQRSTSCSFQVRKYLWCHLGKIWDIHNVQDGCRSPFRAQKSSELRFCMRSPRWKTSSAARFWRVEKQQKHCVIRVVLELNILKKILLAFQALGTIILLEEHVWPGCKLLEILKSSCPIICNRNCGSFCQRGQQHQDQNSPTFKFQWCEIQER